MNKWDKFFLGLAKYVASASKDPSTQTGAVFVSPDRTDVALGYNGFPRGMSDDPVLYADRDIKYSRTVHAEMNGLLLAKRSLRGYTLYTHPFMSCERCAVHMIQAGIVRAVAPQPDQDQMARWGESFAKARNYYTEAGVAVCEYLV